MNQRARCKRHLNTNESEARLVCRERRQRPIQNQGHRSRTLREVRFPGVPVVLATFTTIFQTAFRMRMMNMNPKYLATCFSAIVCFLFLVPTVLVAQEKIPSHAHVSYGPEERQWLNLYLPSSDKPTPVFIYAHHNGSTADDVKKSWATPTLADGTAIVSWESIAKVKGISDFQKCAADAKVMFAWVKMNAATYNFDIDKIIIGGQSRGSFVSWQLAHSQDRGIIGIYMGQALPGRSFNDRLLEPITKKSPPIFLAYRKEPGVVGDNHDPAHGQKVLDRYEHLGIGESAELVHSLSDTKNSEVMQFLPKFIRSVAK